jgi:hypothetical protein
MIVEAEGPARAQNSESTIRYKKGAQGYNPFLCRGRGLSCNCDSEECSYVPSCPIWQKSDHNLVR